MMHWINTGGMPSVIPRSDKIRKIENGIRRIIEAEGLKCPKFFISSKGEALMFHVHAYPTSPEVIWAEAMRKLYPDIAEKVLNKWVTIGETALEILGIDEVVSLSHIRAKDKHGNEWLIPVSGLLDGQEK